MSKKEYLGDSVYVDVDEYSDTIVLTTENGYGPSNTIHLDLHVYKNLRDYVERQQHED